MKKVDPAIEKVRSARKKISHESGNDPGKLIEHYIQYQKRFGDRLREGPAHSEDKSEALAAEHVVAPDSP